MEKTDDVVPNVESNVQPRRTIKVASFVRLFVIKRIIVEYVKSNSSVERQSSTIINELTNVIPTQIQSIAHDIVTKLIDNGIQQYMIEFYNENEHANIIEIIFNQIILSKFAKEYSKETNFVGDNNYQNHVFNSSDLMCLIFQYLEYGIKFDGDLSNCELVNSKWLYHVWNPNSTYFVDLTQLIYNMSGHRNGDNDTDTCTKKDVDVTRHWQRFINAKHIFIRCFGWRFGTSKYKIKFSPVSRSQKKKFKLVLEKIAPMFVNIQQLSLHFYQKYDENIILFWELLNPLIEKNNVKVTVKQYQFIHSESYGLNKIITNKKLKVDQMNEKKYDKAKQNCVYQFECFQLDPRNDVQVSLIEDKWNKWRIILNGPIESPYEGGKFEFEFRFHSSYPRNNPTVTLRTSIYHMNIIENWRICTEIDRYGKYVRDILEVIVDLLREPDVRTPMHCVLAALYYENQAKYEENARKCTQMFAMENMNNHVDDYSEELFDNSA